MTKLYSELKKDMKTGDLLAWNTFKINGIVGIALTLYQKIFKAKFIHVAIVYKEGDRMFLVEATPPNVRLFPISMYPDNFHYIPCNLEDKPEHKTQLLKNLGKKYGLLDFFKGLLNITDDDNEYYCSEHAFDFYSNVGFISNEDAGSTPDSLVEAVMKATGKEPIYVLIDRANLKEI